MAETQLLTDFLEFLRISPTPYHAARNLAGRLQQAGFFALDEGTGWQLQAGGRYYFIRADSTLVAFVVGTDVSLQAGLRLVGAHTDSPCLKVKPQPEKLTCSYQQLGIEVYGGALLNPWFDRDLSLAGRVCYLGVDGHLHTALLNFERPIGVIPSLAIHLDREVNSNRSVNPQTQMSPLLFQGEEKFTLRELLCEQLAKEGIAQVAEVLDFDLSFYDVQPPAVVGVANEFIAGARLDNLLSSFVAVASLAGADNRYSAAVVCNDHEEVGSCSDAGALGTVLDDLLQRLYPAAEDRQQLLRHSLMLSVDNAHGVHPNYKDKHDEQHGPILNRGPVLKYDASQSYATSAFSASFVKKLARDETPIPLQSYVTRADMRCGSTIGPLTAAGIGIKTVDLGVPTFAMHSIRELGGVADITYLAELLARFYASERVAPLAGI